VISGSFLLPSPNSVFVLQMLLKFHKHDSADSMKPMMNEQCLPGLLAIFYKTGMLATPRSFHLPPRPLIYFLDLSSASSTSHLLPRPLIYFLDLSSASSTSHLLPRPLIYFLDLSSTSLTSHLAPRPSHPKPQPIRLNLHLN
jgi:hypothetical protein